MTSGDVTNPRFRIQVLAALLYIVLLVLKVAVSTQIYVYIRQIFQLKIKSVAYIHYGLLGLSHVCDHAIRDDEKDEVLRAVCHRWRIPGEMRGHSWDEQKRKQLIADEGCSLRCTANLFIPWKKLFLLSPPVFYGNCTDHLIRPGSNTHTGFCFIAMLILTCQSSPLLMLGLEPHTLPQ